MRSFYLTGSGTGVTDPRIANTVILGVKLEGVGQTEVSSSPDPFARQFTYSVTGTITFGLAVDGQEIFVLCL